MITLLLVILAENGMSWTLRGGESYTPKAPT
jgi:hypothetical protein